MTAVFVIVAAVLVVLIAFVSVGRESFLLGRQPKQAVFDFQEAVDYVADHLPPEVSARLSYEDVRELLRWHLLYLRDRGVPRWREHTEGGPVVVEDDEGLGWVLGEADRAGLDATDVEVAAVLDLEARYLAEIGAIGGEVEPPDLG
jgi:hypothetical protein